MLKTAIMKTPFYPAARSAYQAIFKPEEAAHKARMGAFYSQFFQSGMRVFDVGANQGEYSEIFAREGARVLAIEPNTAFSARLTALSHMFEIEPVFSATLILATGGIGDRYGDGQYNNRSIDIMQIVEACTGAWFLPKQHQYDAEQRLQCAKDCRGNK